MVILRKSVPGLNEASLQRFLTRARRSAKLSGVVNVLVTSSRELRGLNRRFRGKDAPTDVLSFPPMPGLVDGLAGDIAISADIAARNGKLLGHSSAEEIKILVLHGILHLAGYDHECDQGEMARKEDALRKEMGLPSGLIDRNSQPAKARLRKAG
jgi:probable rRNA maturation factor